MNTERAESDCQGKASLSPSRARKVAQEMRRRGRERMQPYHCGHCGSWHVGGGSPNMPDKRRA